MCNGPYATSSSTVGEKSWSSGLEKSSPSFARIERALASVSSSPRMRTRPDWARRMPFRFSRKVDFPAPLGPISATRSPGVTRSETSRSPGVPSGYA